MEKKNQIFLYKKYHTDNENERLGLFLILSEKFHIKSALYAGSFVHITPSFVFPKVVYVDNNKQAKVFFNDPTIYEFISKKKHYIGKPKISFHYKNFTK